MDVTSSGEMERIPHVHEQSVDALNELAIAAIANVFVEELLNRASSLHNIMTSSLEQQVKQACVRAAVRVLQTARTAPLERESDSSQIEATPWTALGNINHLSSLVSKAYEAVQAQQNCVALKVALVHGFTTT